MPLQGFHELMRLAIAELATTDIGKKFMQTHSIYVDGIDWKGACCHDIHAVSLIDPESSTQPDLRAAAATAKQSIRERVFAFLNLEPQASDGTNADAKPMHPTPHSIRLDMRVQHSVHRGGGKAVGLLLKVGGFQHTLNNLGVPMRRAKVYHTLLPHSHVGNVAVNEQGLEPERLPANQSLAPPMVCAYSSVKEAFMAVGKVQLDCPEPIMPMVNYLVSPASLAPASFMPDLCKTKEALQRSAKAANDIALHVTRCVQAVGQ